MNEVLENARVAVVHDWLYVFGGAERVLRSILRVVPQADVFCLFDVMSAEDRARVGYVKSHTSFMQRMPGIRTRHRSYLPLMPLAIEQIDLSAYDLVISSSYAVAKGVLTGPDQLHLSYVHSPMRYAWDLQHLYLAESGLKSGVKSALARAILHWMRLWDTRTAHGVDAYAVNSQFIGRRIGKTYGRTSQVVYPPVDVPAACPAVEKGGYFLTASRLVSYKNTHQVVQAFASLPSERLVVAGKGPELDRLRSIAGPNVEFRGFVPDEELASLMSGASAFIYGAEEDFGIVMVEAQARGTPVIALGRGGAREIVRVGVPSPTGLFFERPEPELIAAAVREFLAAPERFKAEACHANATRFATHRFEQDFGRFVRTHWSRHRDQLRVPDTWPAAA